MTARGIRNNNPGNIVWTGSPIFRGELGAEPEGTFAIFDTPEHGIEAIARNLVAYQDRHALNTVDGMIRRWSATDQDVYVANVCRALGVAPKDTIDAHDAVTLQRMVAAIIAQENGSQPFTAARIAVCVANALGQAVPAYAPDTQPAAPIEDRSTTLPPEKPMPLLAALLPTVLAMFAPRAQATLQKVTGQPAEAVQPFLASLFDKITQVTGQADPVQAVAALQKAPQGTIDQVQEHALDYLDKLAPMIDKLMASDDARYKADQVAVDSARQSWTVPGVAALAKYLAQSALAIFIVATLGVIGIIAYQVFKSTDGKIDGMMYGLLTIIVYAVARIAESPYRSIFGQVADSQAGPTTTTVINQAGSRKGN